MFWVLFGDILTSWIDNVPGSTGLQDWSCAGFHLKTCLPPVSVVCQVLFVIMPASKISRVLGSVWSGVSVPTSTTHPGLIRSDARLLCRAASHSHTPPHFLKR